MIFKRIPLDNEDENIYLDAYIADPTEGFTRNAILVIPGGAYSFVCSGREGEPVAMAFIPYGYNAFVLHYSVASVNKRTFPSQLIEASKAMKHIKDNANEYNIDPERVFATGFSAGGHLCASLGILWHLKEIYDAVDMPYGYNKPTGIMPIYPVITSNGHVGSFYNLFGTQELTEEQIYQGSLENHVTKDSSPAFIVHTSNDQAVTVKNSLKLANAYADAGMMFEMHIYPDAPHGIALANKITKGSNEKFDNKEIAKWVEHAVAWAESIK